MAYRAIIISLHPEWWREIRLGAKLLEIERQDHGATVHIRCLYM